MSVWSQGGRQFRVGLLVLGSAGLFVGLLGFILGSGRARRVVSYQIAFEESVKGMVVGSRVNFQGVPIGSVQDMRFHRGKTEVAIEVDADRATVQDVTVARLDRLLVTGQVTIELEGYAADAKPLPPGARIAAKESPIDRLARSLPEMLGQTSRLLDSLEGLARRGHLLLGDENLAALTRTLASAEQAASILPRRLDRSFDEVALLAEQARRTLAEAQRSCTTVGDLARRDDLGQTLASLRRATEKLEATQQALVDATDEARGLLSGVRPGLLDLLQNARDSLGEFQLLARQLRLAPSALLFGSRIQDAAASPGGK